MLIMCILDKYVFLFPTHVFHKMSANEKISVDEIGKIIQGQLLSNIRDGISEYYQNISITSYSKIVYESKQIEEYKQIVPEEKIIELLHEYNSNSSNYELFHEFDDTSLKILIRLKRNNETKKVKLQEQDTKSISSSYNHIIPPLSVSKTSKKMEPLTELIRLQHPYIFYVSDPELRAMDWEQTTVKRLKDCISSYISSDQYKLDVGNEQNDIQIANQTINAYGIWLTEATSNKKKTIAAKITPSLLHGKHASEILPLFLDPAYMD